MGAIVAAALQVAEFRAARFTASVRIPGKAALITATTFPAPDRQPEIVAIPRRRLTVRDVLGSRADWLEPCPVHAHGRVPGELGLRACTAMIDDILRTLRVTEARTFVVRDDPSTVVRRMKTADGEVVNYRFVIENFSQFARQLAADAALLTAAHGEVVTVARNSGA